MKNNTIKIILLSLLIVNIVGIFSLSDRFNNKVESTDNLVINDSLSVVNDSLLAKQLLEEKLYKSNITKIKLKIKDNFDYIYPKFKKFNKSIDSLTVKKFAGIIHAYNLDSTDEYRKMYTGQILLESGAKQYHPNGDLVVSSAGAIGMCQIMPQTCLGYFRKHVDTTDIKIMIMLGGDDFIFAYTDSLTKYEKLLKTKKWLSNVNNNMIMWGFITRYNLDRLNNINRQLISYNMSKLGADNYIKNGGNINTHKYIRGIRNKLSVSNID